MQADEAIPVGRPCGLFRQRGDIKFTDCSETAGISAEFIYGHGVACGDFNNDGFIDAAVTGYGKILLFENLGDGTFVEVGSSVRLVDDSWSSSAAWGDLTEDGLLDLYVCHYVDWSLENHPFCAGPKSGDREVCPPRDFTGLADAVFATNSDGSFSNITEQSGIKLDGKGLGVVIADLDNDQRPDIYVTNDTVPNVLYRNEPGKQLADVSLVSGSSLSARGVPDGSMGVHLFDYNNDARFDLWVANYERETSALYEGHGELLFRHVSNRKGVTAVGASFVGWGTLAFDADHDGDEDVLVSNGHVIRYPRSAPLRQLPLMMENRDGIFKDVAESVGDYLAQPHMARGSAMSDLDRDGRIDVIVNHTNEPVDVLRNTTSNKGFVTVRLVGNESSRTAVGATVTLRCGQLIQHRQHFGGGSYASTNSQRLHFGLPESIAEIDAIDIRWPSGKQQTFTAVDADTHYCVSEAIDGLFDEAP